MKKLLTCLLLSIATLAATAASAADESGESGPVQEGVTPVYVDVLFAVEDDGTVRDLTTGQAITSEAQLDAKLGPAGALVVGVIGGAATGAAGAWVSGYRDGRSILIAAIGGGAAGLAMGLAVVGGWTTAAILTTNAVMITGITAYLVNRVNVRN